MDAESADGNELESRALDQEDFESAVLTMTAEIADTRALTRLEDVLGVLKNVLQENMDGLDDAYGEYDDVYPELVLLVTILSMKSLPTWTLRLNEYMEEQFTAAAAKEGSNDSLILEADEIGDYDELLDEFWRRRNRVYARKYLRAWNEAYEFTRMRWNRYAKETDDKIKQSILIHWTYRTEVHLSRLGPSSDAAAFDRTRLENNVLEIWLAKRYRNADLRATAGRMLLRKFFGKWDTAMVKTTVSMADHANGFYCANLKYRFLIDWRFATEEAISERAYLGRVGHDVLWSWRNALRLWHAKLAQAEATLDESVQYQIVSLWRQSTENIAQQSLLADKICDSRLLSSTFSYWSKALRLSKRSHKLASADRRRVRRAFVNWRKTTRRIRTADGIRAFSLVAPRFDSWRLLALQNHLIRERQLQVLAETFNSVRLGARCEQYMRDATERYAVSAFYRWREQCKALKQSHLKEFIKVSNLVNRRVVSTCLKEWAIKLRTYQEEFARVEKFENKSVELEVLENWHERLRKLLLYRKKAILADNRALLISATSQWSHALHMKKERQRKQIYEELCRKKDDHRLSIAFEHWRSRYAEGAFIMNYAARMFARSERARLLRAGWTIWRERLLFLTEMQNVADSRYQRWAYAITSEKWIQEMIRCAELAQRLEDRLDVRDRKLMKEVLRKLKLAMFKQANRNSEADAFQIRVAKELQRTYFRLWRLEHEDKDLAREISQLSHNSDNGVESPFFDATLHTSLQHPAVSRLQASGSPTPSARSGSGAGFDTPIPPHLAVDTSTPLPSQKSVDRWRQMKQGMTMQHSPAYVPRKLFSKSASSTNGDN